MPTEVTLSGIQIEGGIRWTWEESQDYIFYSPETFMFTGDFMIHTESTFLLMGV